MEEIDLIIQKSNLKITKARRDILNVLLKALKPLCYEEIKGDLSMDKATFYRNISIFEEKNIIDKFESEDKKWYFEFSSTSHSHFICNSCNRIECIKDVIFELKSYKVDCIIFKGKCQECLKRHS